MATKSFVVILWAVVMSASIQADGQSYPKDAVYTASPSRVFTGESLREIAFPLGGIGTGSVSLGGRGELRDWEIFNRPDKGGKLDFTFFAIWVKAEGQAPVARVLERKFLPPYRGGGHGVAQRQLSGLARLDEAEFRGEYPFAWITFKDNALPVEAQLEAWNPFIPLNVEDSSLPVAIFKWSLRNPTDKPVEVSLAATISNPIGNKYTNVKGEKPGLGGNLNQFIEGEGLRGLRLSSTKIDKEDPNFGTMALVTTWQDLDVQTRWYRGGWWDQCHLFWDDFSADGRIAQVKDAVPSEKDRSDVGSIVLHAAIPANGAVELPVLLAWHFPNRENSWNWEQEVRGKMVKNYVAVQFEDAWAAAKYAVDNISRLREESVAFHDALYSSTLPGYVIDALSSQASTLKTNVCMRLADGSFFGFEGNSDQSGCCPLNCTHVWNYEQTLAYLFPQLERSMRETDFLHNTLPNGYMTFRTLIPLGDYWWRFKPCADGQMGCIMRAYREWKLSGDSEWLRKLWPKIQSALEFAWKGCGNPPPSGFEWTAEKLIMPWDPNKDGVMEGEQHNTYDIEFYGPNTMMGSLYLGALKAGAEMARALGEKNKAKEYRQIYEKGRALCERKLWNGKYYIQDMYVLDGLKVPENLISPESDTCDASCVWKQTPGVKTPALEKGKVIPKYQYGQGCLSDQLLGQYLAHVVGLDYVLDETHVRKAVKAIFDNNFRSSMAEFQNVQRVYALNDEGGLLLCSWPKGTRPALPFVYSDEVWTGIEYQVAAELIYDGWVDEGLTILKAVRERYNGLHRNPWDEEECGHHYARAMASWAVLLALSGYQYDGVKGSMEFDPALSHDNFSTFWSCGSGWGTYSQAKDRDRTSVKLALDYGTLKLNELSLTTANPPKEVRVTVNDKSERVTLKVQEGKAMIRFAPTLQLSKKDVLKIDL